MDQEVKKGLAGHSYLESLVHLQSSVKLGCRYLKEVEDVMKLTCIASSLVLVVGWGLWFLSVKTFPHDMVTSFPPLPWSNSFIPKKPKVKVAASFMSFSGSSHTTISTMFYWSLETALISSENSLYKRVVVV